MPGGNSSRRTAPPAGAMDQVTDVNQRVNQRLDDQERELARLAQELENVQLDEPRTGAEVTMKSINYMRADMLKRVNKNYQDVQKMIKTKADKDDVARLEERLDVLEDIVFDGSTGDMSLEDGPDDLPRCEVCETEEQIRNLKQQIKELAALIEKLAAELI